MNRLLARSLLVSIVLIHSRAAFSEGVEPPEGFTPLFNGKDLTGWKGLVKSPPERAKMSADELAKAQEAADKSAREHWKVESGVIVFDGKGDNLCTAKDYGDFEMLVDWKIEKAGDSGIYVRGSPQVQIWDSEEGSGGLHNNEKNPSKPIAKADKPVGEWNTFRIKMVGDRVTVRLNDTLVVSDTVFENYWEPSMPIYPTGAIELQNHGNKLYFRNLFVREVPASERQAASASGILRKGFRVAIVGDSITEQKLYSRFIEDYLTACLPDLELNVVQLGWSGERAPGFGSRMDNDLLPWKPDVVTTCYGMNDGSYRKYEKPIGDAYEAAMKDVVSRLKAAGAVVVVGSPGAVDTFSFRNPNVSPKDYNDNLAQLRDIARAIAGAESQPFADVHGAMQLAMQKAKPALGEAYDVCGADGFHPRPNGHIVMAYAFLKGMGLDGDLGSITIDMAGAPSASGGHEVVSSSQGSVEVESRRYPFCFQGDPKSPDSTRSIVPFVPFNEELNRFVLRVKGLSSARAKVRWGQETKSFAREDLEKGINLAAEFPDNPFAEAFQKVDEAIARKQGFETPMIKEAITHFRTVSDLLRADDAELKAAFDTIRRRLIAKDDEMRAAVRAVRTPVRHRIEVAAE